MPRIEQEYIETGKVRYVFRATYHDEPTLLAAEALYCAGEADRFWEMHDWLYFHGDEWSTANDVVRYLAERAAAELGLEGQALEACLREGRYRSRVDGFLQDARDRGVRATPTFLINGRLLEGAYPFTKFRELIEEELAP